MASGGGPRASGTDGSDFKHRQRVDDHYKLMATARRKLRSSSNLQLASALGLTGIAGTSFALPEILGTAAVALCLVSAITAAFSGKFGLELASAQQPEKRIASHSNICVLHILVTLGLGALAGLTVVSTPQSENAWVSVIIVFALLGLVGSTLGTSNGKALANAFKQQRAKSK
eukprot:CAMPEP_0181200854 /NCGR_PEP_ID=MMETSP1096-20121128/17997_1 /TAXON_ID=156174 ORGANISM="Chrysochromulina ericina, Strain CCMP281" /NCGR_SAMPLE_ID=MMETSP1096 /ASSEMBLY_ACC=CAM_ASM_000453 /LENGTH=172 /DNA_ID=CAMNT_0023291261 /DNA_START=48 /DNA_END=566 /DNA_ORIENTATION=-